MGINIVTMPIISEPFDPSEQSRNTRKRTQTRLEACEEEADRLRKANQELRDQLTPLADQVKRLKITVESYEKTFGPLKPQD